MKASKSLSILTGILLVSALSLAACQRTENFSGYGFKTAKITYQISGSSTGSSEVLIKGNKKLIKTSLTQTKVDGSEQKSSILIIQDNEKTYNLDVQKKTGSMIKNPLYLELEKLSPEKRKEKLLAELIRSADGELPKAEKQETVAGKTCDVYTSGYLENCVWEGLPLKTVATLPDMAINVTTIATSVETDIDIPDSEFSVPSDYQITSPN